MRGAIGVFAKRSSEPTRVGAPSASWMCGSTDSRLGLRPPTSNGTLPGDPAQVGNGMALCVLHHKFFDSGLFTVLSDLTVLVGGLAVGDSVEELLNKYGGLVSPEHSRPS